MRRKPIAPRTFLAGVPLFGELDAASIDRLAAGAERRELKRGAKLFRKGDAATGMYVVVFGEIHLVATTPARGARLTGVVGPGQSFGEPVMFLERTAVVDAQAATVNRSIEALRDFWLAHADLDMAMTGKPSMTAPSGALATAAGGGGRH